MKKKIIKRIWPLICIVLMIMFFQSDYFDRNYGYQSDERIRFYVMLDGELLPHEDYSITGGIDTDPIRLDEYGYCADGDYGQYYVVLNWNGRTADSYLENVNDWWRTSVILNIQSGSDEISQTNIIYNSKGKLAESRTVNWNR